MDRDHRKSDLVHDLVHTDDILLGRPMRAAEDPMKSVNVHEAKTHLSRLLERVEAGEEIVIARSGRPIARLVPIPAPKVQRKPGGWKGKCWIADDFAAPLSEEELRLWEGEEE